MLVLSDCLTLMSKNVEVLGLGKGLTKNLNILCRKNQRSCYAYSLVRIATVLILHQH